MTARIGLILLALSTTVGCHSIANPYRQPVYLQDPYELRLDATLAEDGSSAEIEFRLRNVGQTSLPGCIGVWADFDFLADDILCRTGRGATHRWCLENTEFVLPAEHEIVWVEEARIPRCKAQPTTVIAHVTVYHPYWFQIGQKGRHEWRVDSLATPLRRAAGDG